MDTIETVMSASSAAVGAATVVSGEGEIAENMGGTVLTAAREHLKNESEAVMKQTKQLVDEVNNFQ